MSDLWQQLELSTELETDIPDTVFCVRQCLVDFSDRKIQVVSYHCLNKFFANVKIDGFVLDQKSSFKMMGLSFSSKLDWGLYCLQENWTLDTFFNFSSDVFHCLYKSSIWPFLEHCCHTWASTCSCFVYMLHNLQ